MRVTFRSLRWSSLREQLRTSLWVTPVGVSLVCMGACLGLVQLDHALSSDFTGWYVYSGRADGARALLSTIASSMLSIAGVVFSITILVLQLASSQYSPRVLGSFLQDSVTQWSLAMFLGSFVYALTLLPEVRGSGDGAPGFVPGIAVFGSFALAMVSVGFFVRYIHHMAHSIRATSIVARVAFATHEAIAQLYPDRVLQGTQPTQQRPTHKQTRTIENRDAGVVIDVDTETLMEVAIQHDLTLVLLFQVGEFVPAGAPICHVWGDCEVSVLEPGRWLAVAHERTGKKDAAFGFRQLVDIAVRALSPGVNDPTTAVQVLHQLHDLLRALLHREIPSPARVDQSGRLRLFLPRPDWDDYVRLAFEEIRLYGAGSVQVVRRAREILADLLSVADDARAAVLRNELQLFERAAARELPPGYGQVS